MISLSWKVKELDDLGEAKALKNRPLTVENNGEDNNPCRLRTSAFAYLYNYLCCYTPCEVFYTVLQIPDIDF